jgi:hypothetical protein
MHEVVQSNQYFTKTSLFSCATILNIVTKNKNTTYKYTSIQLKDSVLVNSKI